MVSCEWLRRISSLCPLPRFFLVVRISSLCTPLPTHLILTYGRGVFADSTPHRTHARRQQDTARLTENVSHEAEQFNRNNKEKNLQRPLTEGTAPTNPPRPWRPDKFDYYNTPNGRPRRRGYRDGARGATHRF